MQIPQPYFRKFDCWWYVQIRINGKRKQIRLVQGKENSEVAIREYHRVMSAQPAPKVLSGSVVAALDMFVGHCLEEYAKETVNLYRHFIECFSRSIGIDLELAELKPLHVNNWLKSTNWSKSTRAGAIGVIRTAFHWLHNEGYIASYPLHGLKAPQKSRRETIISEEEYEKIREYSDVRFQDYLEFLWETGARPQEAAALQAHHVEPSLRRIVFPPSQAKGKRYPRVIYLNDAAFALVEKLLKRHQSGCLLRNRLNKRWTRNAVRCRFRRLRKIGRFCAYNLRHTWATRALTYCDPITVSVLMGHSDASTLARTYQHLAKNPGTMLSAARKATGEGV
jgi:integrase